ncbi:MAG: hypothetical protein QM708_12045 [Propioniciclava sp.]|uniref:hypothetical protein n=1 Tax=Propioniciclava sp. TaxID=2038686 RepID=UPI0039E6B442
MEYRDHLVADFWRYYGRGLDDLLDAGVPLADVAAMAATLPRESATLLAVHPREEIELWDPAAYLLATAVDQLAGGNWQRGGGKGARPKPIKRPTVQTKGSQDDGSSIDDFAAWYAARPGGRPLAATTE